MQHDLSSLTDFDVFKQRRKPGPQPVVEEPAPDHRFQFVSVNGMWIDLGAPPEEEVRRIQQGLREARRGGECLFWDAYLRREMEARAARMDGSHLDLEPSTPSPSA